MIGGEPDACIRCERLDVIWELSEGTMEVWESVLWWGWYMRKRERIISEK